MMTTVSAVSISAAKLLMKMDKKLQLEKVSKSIDSIISYLSPGLQFANSHMTEFFTGNYWENDNLLPSALRADLETKSLQEIQEHLKDLVNGNWRNYPVTNSQELTYNNVKSLKDLIVATGKLQLGAMGLDISVPLADYSVNGQLLFQDASEYIVDVIAKHLEFDSIMSSKKTHEVQLASDFIHRLSTMYSNNLQNDDESESKISYLVDIGSGKGYLSSHLSLMHNFKVLAVDSSSINTMGCEKRSAKLEKSWVQLVRRALERKETGTCTKRGKNWKARKLGKSNKNAESSSLKDATKESQSDLKCAENNNNNNKLLKTMTEFVTTDFDLSDTLVKYFLNGKCEILPKFGLIGLHTCGTLGVDSLKLFLANENAKFICNVPCCYHLLEENRLFYPTKNFEGSKMAFDAERLVNSIMKPGFPLCFKLDVENPLERFCIGRNARMLSAYSLPRMVHEDQGLEMHSSILHRCLLQVLIKDGLGAEYSEMEDYEYRVGKIGAKCSNFNEYVRKGLQNLKLDSKVQPSDETIAEVYEKFHVHGEQRLEKYYLIRSTFASLVEGLILLDRLAFLLEQESVRDAAIVQLFESSISPRSSAIVAHKH